MGCDWKTPAVPPAPTSNSSCRAQGGTDGRPQRRKRPGLTWRSRAAMDGATPESSRRTRCRGLARPSSLPLTCPAGDHTTAAAKRLLSHGLSVSRPWCHGLAHGAPWLVAGHSPSGIARASGPRNSLRGRVLGQRSPPEKPRRAPGGRHLSPYLAERLRGCWMAPMGF